MNETFDKLDTIVIDTVEQLEIITDWGRDSAKSKQYLDLAFTKGLFDFKPYRLKIPFNFSDNTCKFDIIEPNITFNCTIDIDKLISADDVLENREEYITCLLDGKVVSKSKNVLGMCAFMFVSLYDSLRYITYYSDNNKVLVEKEERKPIDRKEMHIVNKAKYKENREVKLYRKVYRLNNNTLDNENNKVHRKSCDHAFTVRGHYRNYEEKTVVDKNGRTRHYKAKRVWIEERINNKDKEFKAHQYKFF